MASSPTHPARMGTHFMSPRWNHAGWRLYAGDRDPMMDFDHYRRLAPIAEQARFDFILQSDVLAIHNREPDDFPRHATTWPEPVTLCSALAAITEHIGFSVTMSTTFNEPFTVARQIASLDHISNGRASLNVVTSNEHRDRPNFRLDRYPDPADRPEQSLEFVDVVKQLWDSWDDDAVVFDKENAIYARRERVHEIGHEGTWHTVHGPLNVSRPPQGHPVILTAGGSPDFRDRAAQFADVIFTAFDTMEDGIAFTQDVRDRTERHGRTAGDVLVMPTFSAVMAETDAEAQRMWEAYQEIAPATTRGTSPAAAGRIGSYMTVADHIERWWLAGAVDGFVYVPLRLPEDLAFWAEVMTPELQRRGVVPAAYTGGTLRDNLGLPRPGVRR